MRDDKTCLGLEMVGVKGTTCEVYKETLWFGIFKSERTFVTMVSMVTTHLQ